MGKGERRIFCEDVSIITAAAIGSGCGVLVIQAPVNKVI